MMQKLILALALVAGATATSISDELAEWAMREHFGWFEMKFEKRYKNLEHREARFEIFVKNLEAVVSKNTALRAEGKDAIHGITKFSDLTQEEFASKLLNFRPNKLNVTNVPVAEPTKEATDTSFDWRDSNVVTAVKNQAYCGSWCVSPLFPRLFNRFAPECLRSCS